MVQPSSAPHVEVLNDQGVREALVRYFDGQRCTLFAGAGVGKRAGLPDWQEMISLMSEVAEQYEPETATLMRRRASVGLLSDAAHLFKQCPYIPAGEKLRTVSEMFKEGTYDSQPLRRLVALPFASFVSTSYDRSLHDAIAMVRGGVRAVELGDSSMSQAIYWKEPFVARVHGRAEIPESLILDNDDYLRLERDSAYADFLFHLFTRHSCLFIGFSFLDPAIESILNFVQSKVGQSFPRLHAALLPAENDSIALAERLSQFNIAVNYYDPENRHSALWEGIRLAANQLRESPPDQPAVPTVLETTRSFLATCYAGIKTRHALRPLREEVIEGIVFDILSRSDGMSMPALSASLGLHVALTQDELAFLVRRAVDHLIETSRCEQANGVVRAIADSADSFNEDMNVLIEAVQDRLAVREGVRGFGLEEEIREVICDVLVARGWDLAAHFAGAKRPPVFDLMTVLTETVGRCSTLSDWKRERLARACFDLFKKPGDIESAIIVNLSRLAFGVNVVLLQARSWIVDGRVLPERVYLDASVVMPATIPGHPLNTMCQATLTKLQQASEMSGIDLRIFVADVFLDEILAHRRRAFDEVHELGLDDHERLTKHVSFFGASNVNTFIAAWSTAVGRTGNDVPFSQWIEENFPYDTRDTLRDYLLSVGLECATVQGLPTAQAVNRFYNIRGKLLEGYEDQGYDKPRVLIDDEAHQLTHLALQLEAGVRSVFVTADSLLIRIVGLSQPSSLSGAVLSNLGLFQLLDLIAGVDAEERSVFRILWAIKTLAPDEAIREHLIDAALREYDVAMALNAPAIVDALRPELLRAAREEGRYLDYERLEEVFRDARFLDRFEDRFFERMRESLDSQGDG